MTKSPLRLILKRGRPRLPAAAMLLLALLLAGCAIRPAPTRSLQAGGSDPAGRCADFFASLDAKVNRAGVIDAGNARVRHFPYLRVDRFLASFKDEINSRDAFRSWVNRLQALDQTARRSEIGNLPDAQTSAVDPSAERASLLHRVEACGELLKEADFNDGDHREELIQAAVVPDDYIALRNVLGLYPITGSFVSHGVAQWHAEARQRFSVGAPPDWRSIRYAPPPVSETASTGLILKRAVRDELGIPVYSQGDLRALFHRFAPVWEVQQKGRYDRIGSPYWELDDRIAVDTSQPLVYTRLSFTRFGGATLTQLNYITWFSARPKTGALDLYGGRLDGLNYRVTLDNEGRPILYETIHNCGCYYKAYPTNHLRVRQTIPYKEPPLILASPDVDDPSKAMVLAVESGTHYVVHLYAISRTAAQQVTYALSEYGELLSLKRPRGGRRSMFNPYGLVAGSERLERFILWPTGVLSPGAMRQWGRHAVAFVGRRHFDDPFTMDHMFIPMAQR